MVLGFLMIGMAGGFLAGGAAMMLGHTIWMALLVYALTGMTATVLGALASLVPLHRHEKPAFAGTAPGMVQA